MKMKFLAPVVFVIQLLFLQGCIDDNQLDFPDPEEPTELTQSISVVAYLNHVRSTDSAKFDFKYPINLGYPNGISIEIVNRAGLLQTALSQNETFFVDRISFPFLVTTNGVISNIENEEDFRAHLIRTKVPTLRNRIEATLFNCFDLVFPLTLMVDGAEVKFETVDPLLLHIATKPADYQPEIVFPISVFMYSTDSRVVVNSLFGLFKLFDSCKGCPDISFEVNKINLYRYAFESQYEIETDLSAEWKIDGKIISNDVNRIEVNLMPGHHEVCLAVKTPDCQLGTTYCETVTVDRYCPELEFETFRESTTAYKFLATFEFKDKFDYRWVLYKGDQVLKEEHEKVGSQDHKFVLEGLDTGHYKVYLKADIEGCGSLLAFKEFAVPLCRELSFEAQRETTSLGYNFLANFEGRSETHYEWSVFVNDKWVGGKEYKPGTGGDHTFHWQFERGVTYEVCLHQRDCDDTWLCESYIIE